MGVKRQVADIAVEASSGLCIDPNLRCGLVHPEALLLGDEVRDITREGIGGYEVICLLGVKNLLLCCEALLAGNGNRV